MRGLTALTLAAVVVLASAGCSPGAPQHRGRWDEGTSPLGEGYDVPHKSDGTPKKDDDGDGTEKPANEPKDNDENSGGTGQRDTSGNAPSRAENRQSDGIWVRTSVTVTLADENGEEESEAEYESDIDSNGNVKSISIDDDEGWSGEIRLAYDEAGMRTSAEFVGNDRGEWLPDFETGFLGLVAEVGGKGQIGNQVATTGLLGQVIVYGNDGSMAATLGYGQDGSLSTLVRSDGHAEEYDGGLLVALSEGTGEERVSFEYKRDAGGRLSGATVWEYEPGEGRIPVATIGYSTDSDGNVVRAVMTEPGEEFGYEMSIRCDYEWVENPSAGARLYSVIDRYGLLV